MYKPRAFLSIAAMLLATVLSIGCESTQYVSRGDAAMTSNRPHEALSNYQRAAQVDGKLRTDPVFAAKLREASWQAAFLDAQASAASRQWEQAIRQYEAVLDHNPAHPSAAQSLAEAKREGGELRYRKSLDAADRNDLKSAREDLRTALKYDPNHPSARAAFDSLDRRGNATSERRFAASLAHMQQRDWQRAADEFTSIISVDANHLPARAELYKATSMMAESRKAHEVASRLMTDRKLDDAIAAAKRSIDLWPGNAEAGALMQSAQTARSQAQQLFEQAKQQVAQGNYDAGIASIAQSLETDPQNAAALKFSGDIRQTAADAHVAEARRKLAAGEIEAAAGHFRTALTFVPEHRPAKDGLVDVAYSHGQGAEKEGLWGNALLWYLEASAQKPTGIYKQAEDRARAEITKRVAFDLALGVTDARGNTNADTTAMQMRLVAEANRLKPPFATLVSHGEAPKNNGNLPRPLYKAMITMRSIEVRQQLLSRDRKQHTYNAVRVVPNPVLPDLERALITSERDLAFARNRLIRYSCNDCGGRGHSICGSCRGKKYAHCSQCNGTGKIKIKGGGYQNCNACTGHTPQRCSTCNGVGHLRCNRCGGRGFYNEHDHTLIRAKEREVADLRYRLRREPPTIQEQYTVSIPYDQEIYQKTGRMDGSVRIDESGRNESLQTFELAPTFSKQDGVTINANPQVGLPADGLDLPTDDVIYRSLIDDAAKNTIANAFATVTVARANAYITQANEHAKVGKDDLDIEARVAAIVLLEKSQPAEAKRLLDEIRNPK